MIGKPRYYPLIFSDTDRKCAELAMEILGYARNPFSREDIQHVKPLQKLISKMPRRCRKKQIKAFIDG